MDSDKKTMYQAFRDLDEAWNKFVLELCYSLKIDKVAVWLTKKIDGQK